MRSSKLDYCLKTTGDCLKRMKVRKGGEEIARFAKDYYNDALYYKEKEPETALEAVAYSHGFIDAGVLSGVIEIKGYHLKAK